MKRKMLVILSLLLLVVSGCRKVESEETLERFQASYLTLFDTVTSMVGYAENEEEFRSVATDIHDQMLEYHQLYDIYNDYEGINNIKTINDNAGVSPVVVDRKIIDMLLFCKEMYTLSGGKVNVAMGSVLSIWHDYRTEGIADPECAELPHMEELLKANEHCDINCVIIDEEASTVYLRDSKMSLDVGAIAKGYATECVTRGVDASLLLSVGGNVSSSRAKPNGNAWVVGLQDPFSESGSYSHTVYLDKGAVVTSGDYQRSYVVDGVAYHHIIDPETLMPATRWKAVSVIAKDSAVADALSTSLFLMDIKEGEELLKHFDAEAMWTDKEGNEYFSNGFQSLMRT